MYLMYTDRIHKLVLVWKSIHKAENKAQCNIPMHWDGFKHHFKGLGANYYCINKPSLLFPAFLVTPHWFRMHKNSLYSHTPATFAQQSLHLLHFNYLVLFSLQYCTAPSSSPPSSINLYKAAADWDQSTLWEFFTPSIRRKDTRKTKAPQSSATNNLLWAHTHACTCVHKRTMAVVMKQRNADLLESSKCM